MPSSAGAEYIMHEGDKTYAYNNEKYDEAQISDSSSVKSRHGFTHRKLRPRHIQLIGIGGTIGTALYVQIGRGLINGGPASLFMVFTIWYAIMLHKCIFLHFKMTPCRDKMLISNSIR